MHRSKQYPLIDQIPGRGQMVTHKTASRVSN